jgi:hypothetical protein
MSRDHAVLLLCLGLGMGSCHRAADATVADASAQVAPADAEIVAPKASTLPARCQPSASGLSLDDASGPSDLEIGDAIEGASGYAIEIVHRVPTGRLAAVALVPADAAALTVRDLGPTLGDAPPPRVAWRGGEMLAVSYALSKRPDVRELSIYSLPGMGEARVTGTILESRDDSLAFDLASSLVVWDEAKPGAVPRGVIRIAEIGADARPGVNRDLSPAESDAEVPRIGVTAAGEVLVFWIARRPEAPLALDASPSSEVTGEARAYSWLEVISVDTHGVPVGPARRLTSSTGHVGTYDIEPLPRSGARKENPVLVVARDDGEAVDGSGGVLLRVRVRADGQDTPVAFATDGLGRGSPAFVDGAPPWLSWVAPREEGRLLALDASGTPIQLPSAEPSLDEGRPLAWLDQGKRMLAAMPGDPARQLRILTCSGAP